MLFYLFFFPLVHSSSSRKTWVLRSIYFILKNSMLRVSWKLSEGFGSAVFKSINCRSSGRISHLVFLGWVNIWGICLWIYFIVKIGKMLERRISKGSNLKKPQRRICLSLKVRLTEFCTVALAVVGDNRACSWGQVELALNPIFTV